MVMANFESQLEGNLGEVASPGFWVAVRAKLMSGISLRKFIGFINESNRFVNIEGKRWEPPTNRATLGERATGAELMLSARRIIVSAVPAHRKHPDGKGGL